MMRWLAFLSSACTWGFAGAPSALAHHSFAGVYDTSKEITLEGIVHEFQFVHPHPILVVHVAPAQPWRAEMDNLFELTDIGVTADTFKPGDRVHISGSPGRTQARILYLWKLERPSDGLRYAQVGSTPTIRWAERR